ncbi:Carbohydrate esterase family 4 protein [Mycena indigotica]|uniref:Carbohydrate esterase family 4 protein n=1 Tax=Mycena indigotica TaxID=2126181 RepID=A0A8H6T856_9AGAR|nr:Carbohydrate esterase family 4 protein [Mycena indigotica]KAF7311981.1 Carbohydrate esterase family 4 protein [Mycena indigotica]
MCFLYAISPTPIASSSTALTLINNAQRHLVLQVSSPVLVMQLGLLIVSCIAAASAASTPNPPRAQVILSCTVPGTVALTFDDGPYLYQDDISQMLLSKGAKGTFFMVTIVSVPCVSYFGSIHLDECIYGTKVAARLTRTYQAGHQIASHTWSHPDLTALKADEITNEFNKTDIALAKILGITSPYLRPPYGNYNKLVRQIAYQFNKTLILWDMDTEDSIGATVEQSLQYYDQYIANNSVTIPLQHETEKTTAYQVLPAAIDKLQAAGLRLVTLAECLNQTMYTSELGPGTRDSSWFCPEERSSSVEI